MIHGDHDQRSRTPASAAQAPIQPHSSLVDGSATALGAFTVIIFLGVVAYVLVDKVFG